MKISIIVATSKNNAIGVNNQLPWHLPADLKYFKQLTTGHVIIMGSNTFLSIGKPLPNRTTIVITTQTNPDWLVDGIHIVHSIAEAIDKAKSLNETECFIIGGAKIYQQTLHLADIIYKTEIDVMIENADAFFPSLNATEWKLVAQQNHLPDEKNKMNY
ncbi:MAG: type 3 dihydrofolate reductase, partial [Bacteroidota bacterium]